jgi:PAS domain S-box-containing protein
MPSKTSFPQPCIHSLPKRIGLLIVLAVLYAGLGHLVLRAAQVDGNYTSFWPSAGVAIAMLYLYGLNLWPGVFLGTLAVHLTLKTELESHLLVAVGNTLEAVLGAWLLRRSSFFSPKIGKLRDAVQIIVYAAILAGLCSTVFGVWSMVLSHTVSWENSLAPFLIWWTGNVTGILVVTPTILAWANPRTPSFTFIRKIECGAVFILGAVVGMLTFCLPTESPYFLPAPFLMFLFITWVALRFSQRTATMFILVLACITIWGTMHGSGAFSRRPLSLYWAETQRAQLYIAVCATISMMVSATTTNLYQRSRRLENSERRYRQLFDSGPDPLWIYSPETQRILAVNECAIARVGYTREEFLALNVSALIPGEEAFLSSLQSLPTSDDSQVTLASLRRKDGGSLRVRLTIRSADFFGKSAIHLLAQDVSEQIRAEDELRKSEMKLKMHLQQTSLGAVEWNRNFEITEWNLAAERIFGYCKEEALGLKGGDLIVPEHARPVIAKLWNTIINTTAPVRSVNENMTKSGESIICEWFNTPLVDKDGKCIGAASLVQDVTLRESIKESVRESEEKFRSVIESSPMGIQIYEMRNDRDLILIGANPAAQNFMGFKNEDVLGKTIEQAFPDIAGTEIPAMYRRAAVEGRTSWSDQVIYDGAELTAAYEVNAFQTVPGKMVAMFLDVTERRRTEQALRLRDKAMETISQGIVIMSHLPDGSSPIIYANPAFEKITDYTEKQIVGQDWKILTGPDSEKSEVQAIEKAFLKEEPIAVEMRSYRQDGTTFQSSVSISPIVD